ncbi:FmdB family zinc ribbon protein [Ktedonobacter racemifer]|uniref:Regulatory protein, FmdB family n=1 Tax=Ktedonobacter racemifer DSM 44963 TaxID=485913 RepID=D6U1V1_KTERA|nr:FmdB family zinc ribbon protein [Ktedonobacter racemifer]EFH80835.1 regulatory protein, FmdB family [Ktedonobacter racemifer DSM 44963]
MPMYEFVCPTCRTHFDELRPVREADDTAWCPACATVAVRQLSRFAFKKAARARAQERESTLQRSGPVSHPSGCACCFPSPPRTQRA